MGLTGCHSPLGVAVRPSDQFAVVFMADLDTDLYICSLTAVTASLLQDRGFVMGRAF